jgi:polyhydroxybutyrate depolymerase
MIATLLCVAVVGVGLSAATAHAQDTAVRAVFERYNLFGTFAQDCTKAVSQTNWYFVHRAIDDDHVQRDMLEGPSARKFVFIFDKASVLGPAEIAVSGTRDGERLSSIWRVEPTRHIETEATLRGNKVISGAKFLSNGRPVPWLDRCGGLAPEQLLVNGKARTFLLERPTAPGPHPTIIMLHGYTKDAADIAEASGLARLAPRQGFVAAFPDGLGHQWNHYLPGKELPFFVKESQQFGRIPDDVAFLEALVADLVKRGISDPRRIYLAGESNGGFMTMRMICSDVGMFAAAGVLIGGMPETLGADCHPAKPIPLLMVHGSADRTVPYGGGVVPVGAPVAVWPTERTVAFFRGLNGCIGPNEQTVAPGQHTYTIQIERSIKCGGAPVVFYRVVGGGHARWPDLNVGQLLLDFFRDKAR